MWIDDNILQQCHKPFSLSVFKPEQTLVVLGSSNHAETECFMEHITLDQVSLLRRYGGGGTVVLYPGCLVVSLGAWVHDVYGNSRYFRLLNDSVIDVLSPFFSGLNLNFHQAGISDICIQGKKIAGTSMFRSRNYLLYQASILIKADFKLIGRYLKHPSREPDYRGGKSHEEFLTDLSYFRHDIHADMLKASFDSSLLNVIARKDPQFLATPDERHIPHILKRCGSQAAMSEGS